jgi:hypothetical protein
MSLPDPTPQRLSDRERDAAVSALRAHLDVGRLTQAEFDERMQAALAARTPAEIAPLFGDLPDPHPDYLASAQPTWNTYPAGGRPPEPGAPTYGSPTYGAPSAPYGTPQPGGLVPRPNTPLPRTQTDRILDTVQALLWPVAIVLLIFGDAGIWPIILAIIVSTAIGAYRGQRKRRQPPPY